MNILCQKQNDNNAERLLKTPVKVCNISVLKDLFLISLQLRSLREMKTQTASP